MGTHNITLTAQNALGTDTETLELTVSELPTEIIVDNLDANTSKSGMWVTSSGTSPWAGNSIYSETAGSSFRWIPTLGAGTYEVYAWWSEHANRNTAAPYTITHADGSDTVPVNQQQNAGQWNLLGTFSFEAGGAGHVEVSSGNGQACADAVSFVKTGGSAPMVTVAAGSEPLPAEEGSSFTQVTYGEGEDEVEWVSDGAIEGDELDRDDEAGLPDDGSGGGGGGCFVGVVRP